ncbi:cupin domain-containing protein [Accumulibacter sp.]|uniref:cupin domain-containing protein n=1 Tax=Accumulibacter sp. TaxID=2053492 RepID=UPI0025D3D98E|nr:cupin domain-containing protein [Accumulibacter sp.]MCM8594737.1 cupin domain-containing protein [Accumulibacter sp.]MDS4048883.1 cupin domain-containing protein [Accumulibacter sp.]
MYIHAQTPPLATALPGIAHSTWAGQAQGLTQLTLWRQSVAPGGATPPHRHDCEEIVICLAGSGELHIAGEVHRFAAGETIAVPRDALHQIFSTGEEPMEIIAVLAAAPVAVYLPDDQRLDLPWPA